MSWGYWGIVTGVAMLVCVFFVAIEIMVRGRGSEATNETIQAERDTKHAA